MRKYLTGILLSLLFLPVCAIAQQPQSNAPVFSVNSKYVQGVGIGYAPTAGAGLVLNIAAGTAFCNGTIATYAGGTLTMTNSTTNYVYLDAAASCAPAVSTSTFTAANIPIAIVVASGGAITTITDDRTMFEVITSSGSAFGTPPTTPNITFLACDVVSGGVSTLGFCLPGMPGRTVSGASDTIVATDRGSSVLYTNGGAVAVAAPQLGTTNFANNFNFAVKTASSTVVTITPTTSQIAGNNGTLGSSLVIPASSVAYCYGWDNTNYQCTVVSPPGSGTVSTTGSPASGNLAKFSGAAAVTNGDLSGDASTSGTLAVTLASKYKTWQECSSRGLGDGLNGIPAGTYLQLACVNDTGATVTLTGIHCYVDNASATSTLNATNNTGTGLLTGAITCNNTKASGGAAGTQSGTTTLANGDAISFTFVADGTSKQTNWTVSGNF